MADLASWRSKQFSAEETDLLVHEVKARKQTIYVPVCVTSRVYTCCEPTYEGSSNAAFLTTGKPRTSQLKFTTSDLKVFQVLNAIHKQKTWRTTTNWQLNSQHCSLLAPIIYIIYIYKQNLGHIGNIFDINLHAEHVLVCDSMYYLNLNTRKYTLRCLLVDSLPFTMCASMGAAIVVWHQTTDRGEYARVHK